MPNSGYPRPGAGGPTGEPWYGRLIRTMPLPYGAQVIPQITHSIMGGVRHRQNVDNSRSSPGGSGAPSAPTGLNWEEGGNSGYNGDPYTAGGLPLDIPPEDYGGLVSRGVDTGQYNYDPNVPQGDSPIDPRIQQSIIERYVRQAGQPPSAPTGAHVEGQPPVYYDPSGQGHPFRNPMSFSDSRNQGEAYGGEFNQVGRGREEGNMSYPLVAGQHTWRIDPETGAYSPTGGVYNPNQQQSYRPGVPRDTQAWVEQQYRMAYPRG